MQPVLHLDKEEAYHAAMHVITRKRLNEFAEKYPETKTALAQRIMQTRGRRNTLCYSASARLHPIRTPGGGGLSSGTKKSGASGAAGSTR